MRITLRVLVPSLLACLASAADTSYLVPAQGGVVIRPIATAGDSFASTAPVPGGAGATGKQILPGLPDGLGGWLNGTDLHLISNHEFTIVDGITRTHGGKGAFLSHLTLDTTSNLAVTDVHDVIHTVYRATRTSGAPTFATDPAYVFQRFCSADLPAETAVYNSGSGKGVQLSTARLYFNGEEVNGKSPWLHVVDGTFAGQSVELPTLGMFNFENLLACPAVQDKTIIIGQDDNAVTNSFVVVWVGDKAVLPGSPADVRDYAAAAGLTNGKLHVIKAGTAAIEDVNTLVGASKGTSIPFTLPELGTAGDVTTTTWSYVASPAADPQRTDAATKGTKFFRPEDGCWDPSTPGVYYFVTTHQNDDFKDGLNGLTTNAALPAAGTAAVPQVGRSRLWKLVFSDITNPTAGGTITCLIDGTENPGPQMMDNISVDHHGRIMICEDPGGTADFAARLWVYDTASGFLTVVAKHDPANNGDMGRGAPTLAGTKIAPSAPFNRDEESSGVIDAEALLGAGHWLIDTQNHSTTGRTAEVLEGGQYMDIYVPTTFPTGGTLQSGRLATITTDGGDVAVRDSGYGSAMAFAPGKSDEIYLLTDRGPNVAGPSNSILFPLPSFTPRIGKFKLNGDGTMDMLAVISLKRADGTPLTGLPLPAGTTGSTGEVAYALKADGTADTTLLTDAQGIDSEGLVALPDGTFWISDEYGPFLLHVAADGTTIERIAPGTANAQGHKLPAVLAKRIINKGMEGLTVTPDGTKLVGMMQSTLGNGIPAPGAGASADDEAKKDSCLRIMVYTLATGAVQEYVYLLEDMVGGSKKGGAVSEIVAISNTQFLVDERDGKFLNDSGSKIKSVFKIDISGATDIHDSADGVSGKLFGGSTPEALSYNITQAAANTALTGAGITPVTKTLAVDLRTGSYPTQYNHDKIEGLALRGSTLWLANDDDFGVTDNGGITSKDVLKSTTGSNLAGTQTRGMADFSQVISIDLSGAGVAATNAAPGMTSVAAQTLHVGTNDVINVTVGDAETAAGSLTFAASSSDTAKATVAVSGSGSARVLTITPVAAGTATVTLTVNDGSITTTQTVAVTVAANTAPTMSTVAAQALTVGTPVTVNVTVADAETAAAALTFAGSSSATGAFTVATGGSGATRTVTLTPVAAGAGNLTLTVNDGTTTTTQTVSVTVVVPSTGGGSTSDDKDDSKCGVGSGMALASGLLSLMGLFLIRRRR